MYKTLTDSQEMFTGPERMTRLCKMDIAARVAGIAARVKMLRKIRSAQQTRKSSTVLELTRI